MAETSLGAQYVIIPKFSECDPETCCFNAKSVEAVIPEGMVINPNATMVVNSNFPVCHTARKRLFLGEPKLVSFSGLLREGRGEHLRPRCIVVGEPPLMSLVKPTRRPVAYFNEIGSCAVRRDFLFGDVRRSYADVGEALQLLGHQPNHGVARRLAEVMKWCLGFLSLVLRRRG